MSETHTAAGPGGDTAAAAMDQVADLPSAPAARRRTIASHPAVRQVAVIGVPSEEWGEAVHAIVVLKDDAEATETEIIDHAREWIAGYKVPKSVTFRSEPLPLFGAMKVLKRELRAPFWEGQDRNVG